MTAPTQPPTPEPTPLSLARRRRKWAERTFAVAMSLGGHVLILTALFQAAPTRIEMPEPEIVHMVSVLPPPPPAPSPEPRNEEAPEAPKQAKAAPPPKAKPTPPKPPPPQRVAEVRPRPVKTVVPSKVAPVPAAAASTGDGEEEAAPVPGIGLTAGQIAGLGRAGSGSGAGCDMVQRLQAELRKDPAVRSAVAQAQEAAGADAKAILVWDGQWVQSPGQEGRGLAIVRQSIAVKVGFAPEACRAEPVRGRILIALNDAGTAQIVLGEDRWRWSDLLFAPGARPTLSSR